MPLARAMHTRLPQRLNQLGPLQHAACTLKFSMQVKLWNLAHPTSLRTFAEHTYCV